eukprot:m.24514 g.24514  ORF g.24514 m.24514 type:complete len:225 (-) comp4165_c0_seq2:2105-2779(-)
MAAAKMSGAVVQCVCGRASLRFPTAPFFALECGCRDCRQAREYPASLGGPKSPSGIGRLVYFPNDMTPSPSPTAAPGDASYASLFKVTMLRADGWSRRIVSTCCESTLAVDNPFYRSEMVLVPIDSCRVTVSTPLPQPLARIHMESWDPADGDPPAPDPPTLITMRSDDVDHAEKAEVYRSHFRKAKTPLPRQGMSIQDLIDAVGPVEVLNLPPGKCFPPKSEL